MIGVFALLVVFVAVPGLVYLTDWRRRRRTKAELEEEAVRAARDAGEGPGSHEPLAPTLPTIPWNSQL